MSTKSWGKPFWIALSATALGFHLNQDHKLETKIKHYKTFFNSLQFTLPCGFCRDSYKIYYKKLNIERYMRSQKKWAMIKFIYDLKECVNRKLRAQERKLFEQRSANLTLGQKQDKTYMKRLRSRIFTTKATPPYASFLKRVLRMRPRVCSNKIGSCVTNAKKTSKREIMKLAPHSASSSSSKSRRLKTN